MRGIMADSETDQQLGQLYELMQAIRKQHEEESSDNGSGI